MIIIGIGANLSHPDYGLPRRTCGAALSRLTDMGVQIVHCSPWYESAPVLSEPREGQPWYVNGVIAVHTELEPEALLDILLSIEAEFGRVRSVTNAPRTLDLDLVAYHERQVQNQKLIIPHPRLHQRAFVLIPLAQIAPDWCHPVSKQTVSCLLADLPVGQEIRVMKDATGAFATEWPAPKP